MGHDVMERISESRVIIFGVGGVGSWCAESLVRSGIRHLTIVDSDRVSVTNINRQSMANVHTVGRVKVDVLRKQLLAINPDAEICALQQIYSAETADSFDIKSYDYVIDAIDSLDCKMRLILHATQEDVIFFSSMGAALKMDPSRIQTAEFWKVKGCPLARALRNKMKRGKTFPSRKFKCVYSDEVLPNLGVDDALPPESSYATTVEYDDEGNPLSLYGDPSLLHHDWTETKAQVNGTVAHTTAIFGFTLAGLVLQHMYETNK